MPRMHNIAAAIVYLLGIVGLSIPATAQVFDQLKCYKIKDAAKFRATAAIEALQAEFGVDDCQVKGRGKMLCVPAAADTQEFEDRSRDGIEPYPFFGQELFDERICYKIKCPQVELDDHEVTDPFGSRTVSKLKPSILCTPAFAGTPTTTTTTTTTLPPGPRLVFVTRSPIPAIHIGGLAGADARCDAAATAASLPGTYMAWLSDTNESPTTRFTLHNDDEYRRVDGVVVANDWDDLVDGDLLAPINVDETGETRLNTVWTNTHESGVPICTDPDDSNCDCKGWTMAGDPHRAWVGDDRQAGQFWTRKQLWPCTTYHSLYCFQQ